MRTLALLVACSVSADAGDQELVVISRPMPKLDSVKAYVERGEARLAVGWQENAVRVVDADGKVHFRPGWPQGIPTEDFDAALELDPKCVRAFVGRGVCYTIRRKYADAIKDFDTTLALDPKNSKALAGRADAFCIQSKPDYGKALRDYDRAIELDPNDAHAYVGRGWIYLFSEAHQDSTKGFDNYRRACEVTKFQDWEYLQLLVRACVEKNKYAEAARWQREIEKDFKRRGEPLPTEMTRDVEKYEEEAKKLENR